MTHRIMCRMTLVSLLSKGATATPPYVRQWENELANSGLVHSDVAEPSLFESVYDFIHT